MPPKSDEHRPRRDRRDRAGPALRTPRHGRDGRPPHGGAHARRAGEELILVGATEHSITPIRVYSGDEAVTVEAAVGETGFGLPPAPRGSAGLVETLRRWTVRQ